MLIEKLPLKVSDNVSILGTSAYLIYLIHGEREAAIIEGGTGPMGPVLRIQLKEMGIAEDAIHQVIITHGHPDHVMAVPLFQQMFPKVEVLASETAAKTLSIEKAVSVFCRIDGELTESLLKSGQIGEEHKPEPLTEMRIGVDRTIGEGDVIRVDDTELQVLSTPGHSDCSLSFYDPKEKLLIVADATGYYVPEKDCWWPNYFSNYGQYIDSMGRLRDIGAETLCLSHNAIIQGADEVRDYLDRDIADTEAYHQRILREMESGKSVREMAEQLGAEIYKQTQLLPLTFFQKNCGVLVKLSLKHEGIEPPEKK